MNGIDFECVHSPREYNFANDNIYCKISPKIRAIKKYLSDNEKLFAQYLKGHYTSYSGFLSGYPNTIAEFMEGKPFEHKHKLGSILDFICDNEGITSESLYYNLEAYLSVSNYDELLPNETATEKHWSR